MEGLNQPPILDFLQSECISFRFSNPDSMAAHDNESIDNGSWCHGDREMLIAISTRTLNKATDAKLLSLVRCFLRK